MGLPKIIISLSKKASTLIKRSSRGVVVLLLKDDTNDDITTAVYTSADDDGVDTENWTTTNIDYIKKAFLGGPAKVICERVGATSSEQTYTLEAALKRLSVTKFNYNYTAMSNKKNLYIVIHYVGGVSAAKNNVDYYAREKLSASATYFVDETSIWQCVEDCNRAWHCGGGLQGSGGHTFHKKCTNSNSIGIEMCCKKTASGSWYFESDTVKNTIELTKHLMQKYNVPIDRVIRHYDVTGKICPEPYVRDETAWSDFKNRLTNKEDEPMTSQEKASFDALVKAFRSFLQR